MSILDDKYLKSYELLLKEKKIVEGQGTSIYSTNKFVFFSCVDKLFKKQIYGQVILYFNSKLLYDNTFYIANHHTTQPTYLCELDNIYNRKIKKHSKNYNNILYDLFIESYNILPYGKAFYVFQQIAIKNKVSLN